MERSCMRCGKRLHPGTLGYVVEIKTYADFDGVLIEPEGDLEGELEAMLKKLEELDPEEAEKDVFEEFSLLLCRSCRDRFVDEAKHPWEGPFRVPGRSDPIMH